MFFCKNISRYSEKVSLTLDIAFVFKFSRILTFLESHNCNLQYLLH